MILIGSQALNHYIPLQRKLHDHDFIASKEDLAKWNIKYGRYSVKTTEYSHIYDIEGDIVEIRNPEHLDPTDLELLAVDASQWLEVVQTKFGAYVVPSIETLYDIKKSTALCIDEPKHKHDLDLIQAKYPILCSKGESSFFKARLQETQNRVAKSKKAMYKFFHKYEGIPEYIQHDRLHNVIADLVGLNMPTYKRLTVDDTTISKSLFDKLTHKQKVSLMAEESLVLALERWYIPQNIENGINYRLIDMFYNNNEAMPTYHILKHVNITGLKTEADYIVQFGRDYFFEIEKKWIEYKEKIKEQGGFPSWFKEEIFNLRKRYLNGESVATV